VYRERATRIGGAVLWESTEPGPGGAPRRPVLPDGCMDLIWLSGELVVAGPGTRAHTPDLAPGSRSAGVRFPPGAAPALLGLRMGAHELRDQLVPGTELWTRAEARELDRAVAAAADPAAAVERAVLARAPHGRAPDPLMRAVAARLAAGGTGAATADEAGIGARQLHRRSLAAFGYGPKTLARVLRLQRALALVGSGTPYASAAALSGCADQAHLAREVRALTGLTLGAYEAFAYSDTSQPSGSSSVA
jgi:AraC-like DNA-binding protein